MMFAPLEGWRHVEVTDRHTAVDYAQILKALSDTHFPKADKIVLVQDNLNTHKPASLYRPDRGRDGHYWLPPAQIRTCAIYAYGSHLGCLAANRSLGQG